MADLNTPNNTAGTVVEGQSNTQAVQNVTNTQGQQTVQAPIQVQAPVQVQPVTNMFTQEQVNSIVSNRVNTANNTITELNGKIKDLTDKLNAANASIKSFEQKGILDEFKIPTEFKDYAIFEANKLVTDKVDFKAAVEEVLKNNAALKQYAPKPEGDKPEENKAGANNAANTQYRVGSTPAQGTNTPLQSDVDSEVAKFLESKGFK